MDFFERILSSPLERAIEIIRGVDYYCFGIMSPHYIIITYLYI